MTPTKTTTDRAIILVTGANTGIGFGFCERCLEEFINGYTTARFFDPSSSGEPTSDSYIPSKALTLILACRNRARAEAARDKLLRHVDNELSRQSERNRSRAESFRDSVQITTVHIDLTSLETVFKLGKHLQANYPYISHLFLNAGYAHYETNAAKFLKQLFTKPSSIVVDTSYIMEYLGELTDDGFGLIWQANFFAHFALYCTVKPLILASPAELKSRVIWSGSQTASQLFEWDDPQLVKCTRPYASVKYQIQLISFLLDSDCKEKSEAIRHFCCDPGLVSTSLGRPDAHPVEVYIRLLIFYVILRTFVGHPALAITSVRGALPAVHLATMSNSALANYAVDGRPTVLNARCTRFGKERLAFHEMAVEDWEPVRNLLDYCYDLYTKSQRALCA